MRSDGPAAFRLLTTARATPRRLRAHFFYPALSTLLAGLPGEPYSSLWVRSRSRGTDPPPDLVSINEFIRRPFVFAERNKLSPAANECHPRRRGRGSPGRGDNALRPPRPSRPVSVCFLCVLLWGRLSLSLGVVLVSLPTSPCVAWSLPCARAQVCSLLLACPHAPCICSASAWSLPCARAQVRSLVSHPPIPGSHTLRFGCGLGRGGPTPPQTL